MKVTIDNKEHEVDENNTELVGILNTVKLGDNSLGLLNHIIKCVDAVHQGKVNELKNALGDNDGKDKPKKSKK
tara:strand:+ start:162 stop:380 length:219 start_codon:yes stop_codon:yes gene_type:complete